MAARCDADTRPRSGGYPMPQTIQEVEEVVQGALAKLAVVADLLDAYAKDEQDISSGVLISPRDVIRQAEEDLFNIEWPAACPPEAAAEGGA
jgi:hypothetical protein